MTLKKIILSVAVLSAFSVSAFFFLYLHNKKAIRYDDIKHSKQVTFDEIKRTPEKFNYVILTQDNTCANTLKELSMINWRKISIDEFLEQEVYGKEIYTGLQNNQTALIYEGKYFQYFETMEDCQKEIDLYKSEIKK